MICPSVAVNVPVVNADSLAVLILELQLICWVFAPENVPNPSINKWVSPILISSSADKKSLRSKSALTL